MNSQQHANALEQRVRQALRQVVLGEDGLDVVAAGHVYDVVATGGVVRVLLDPEQAGDDAELLAAAVAPLVSELPGVARVVVKPRPRRSGQARAIPGIQHVLAVHSGKGGVGKSTVAANLALALAAPAGLGLRVGLLDADVYGPSAPLLFGLTGRVSSSNDGLRIAPRQAHGVKLMSLGFLLPEGKALAWRGALVDQGLPQLLNDVAWGELDVLLIDLPPGTSDVHLALIQAITLSGVVTVTAPDQLSVQDVQRGMEMFADLAVPCLGLIENMAGVNCRRCGHGVPLFGIGGGEQLAAETGLPLLASIPFRGELISASEAGTPITVANPASATAQQFRRVADILCERLAPVGKAVDARREENQERRQ